ncbi:dipeptide ABC transporter ATP-binding protein [Pseudomonas lopnurensis]|uniref:dipeptide ABC transporter ATP-binding protein n=1 Tax=Pseudomonas lopnurensis TaxID=1477517 RepID=UPI00187AA0A5|nr:ABC transporter ATP-binding protein [Pseudomonas lopnurensis]MBE7375704.1 ABC transporter ATP-binding protein [Pseudomonas lopnurensis]
MNLSSLAFSPVAEQFLAEPEWLLEADGLSVVGGPAEAPSAVLSDLSFRLAAGRTLGLVGESGAGKSMIGRVLARQLPAGFRVGGGQLRFAGEDLLSLPAERHRQSLGSRIAFIPQEPMGALNPVLTIGRQLIEHLQRLGTPAAACRERAIELLEQVCLPRPATLLGHYPFELSGGMCQRVMIAMAFAGRPQLVVSDEATTALDVSSQAHIVRLLRELQEQYATAVLFVTHDMGLATHACDDVLVLYAGQIMESGPAKSLFRRTLHPYTRALREAIPALEGPLLPLRALAGQMPGVESFAQIKGCRFAGRCEQATQVCHDGVAPLESVGPQHQVRCWNLAAASERQAQPEATAHEPGRAMSAQQSLVAKGLSKTWPGRRQGFRRAPGVAALKPLDLSIAPGEFIGIVGESGSGKSTLARLIMGLERQSTGVISLNGEMLGDSRDDWTRRIASIQMIFQDATAALNPRWRIGRLLTQSMLSQPRLHSERQARAAELAADVGLAASTLKRYPSQLSGGQRQRVNIGRSLCDTPQILVADEIVSGLDVSVQAQVMNLLLELRRQHKISLLLISHDLGVVRYLCSRVLVLHQGELVEQGETERVLAHPQHPYTRALIAAVPSLDPDAQWPPAAFPQMDVTP